MLVHERLLNGYGVWVDAEPTRQVVKAFKTLGENIAESLSKGDRVFVHGTITTEVWTDKDNGDKRTAQRVLADIVGPSLRGPPPVSPRPPALRQLTRSVPTGQSTRSDREAGEGVREREPPGALLAAPAGRSTAANPDGHLPAAGVRHAQPVWLRADSACCSSHSCAVVTPAVYGWVLYTDRWVRFPPSAPSASSTTSTCRPAVHIGYASECLRSRQRRPLRLPWHPGPVGWLYCARQVNSAISMEEVTVPFAFTV